MRRTTRWTGDAWQVFVVVAVAYAAGAVLAWLSFGAMSGPAFFFPAAGVTLAAMLLSRPSAWPAIVGAVVVGELGVDVAFGAPPLVAVGYSVANVVEPLIGASVIRSVCGGAPDLTTRRGLAVFIGAGCLLGPITGGLIGGTVAAHHEGLAWLPTVSTWWAGDALGALVVGAPILLWPQQSWVFTRHRGESAAALALTLALGIVAFRSELPPSLIMLPLLVWAALRLNVIGAALTGTVMGFLANSMYTRADFFAGIDLPESGRLLIARVFLGVLVVVAMLIAQESAGRTAAQQLHEAERRERRRLQSLAGLAQQLSAALTRDDIGEAIAAHVLDDAGAAAVNLGVVSADRTRLEWVCIAGYAAPITARYKNGIAMTDRTAATDTITRGEPQRFPPRRTSCATTPRASRGWTRVPFSHCCNGRSPMARTPSASSRSAGANANRWTPHNRPTPRPWPPWPPRRYGANRSTPTNMTKRSPCKTRSCRQPQSAPARWTSACTTNPPKPLTGSEATGSTPSCCPKGRSISASATWSATACPRFRTWPNYAALQRL